MGAVDHNTLTAQQRQWFQAIRSGLERDTGRSLEDWVALARTCPETTHRARLSWFKATHGLLQNRASYVLREAFPPTDSWDRPEGLRAALWSDPASRLILEAVEALVLSHPEVIAGQRKGFSAWSRRHQFLALRPARGGGAVVGFALEPDAAPRLEAARKEGWSERLKSRAGLRAAAEVDAELAELIARAWARS